MRLATDYSAPAPSSDDLLALADAVREAARPAPATVAVLEDEPGIRRGHLRMLPPDAPGAEDH